MRSLIRIRLAERRSLAIAAALALAPALAPGAAGVASSDDAGETAAQELTLDQLLSIRHPAAPTWSPEGERLAFLWQEGAAIDLWWVSEGIDEPRAVTRGARRVDGGQVSSFSWTADGRALVYALGGDLYLYTLATGAERNLTESPESESGPAVSADGTRLAFVRDGDVWVATFPQMEATRLTEEEGSFRSPSWCPDGGHLAVLYSNRERVGEETAAQFGDKLEFFRWHETAADVAVVAVADGSLRWLERGNAFAGAPAWSSRGQLAWQEVSADAERRRILVAEAPLWQPVPVVDETDEAWWSLTYLDAGPRWEPDGGRFVYISDRNGWAHLYLASPDAEEEAPSSVQLTRGDFEVEAPSWDPAGERLVVSANRASATERGLFLLEVPADGDQQAELEPISRLRGTSTGAIWRPDGEQLAFLHADPEKPLDVWVQEPREAEARQLTDSWEEGDEEIELILPQPVRFASSDGRLVPAQLILPPDDAIGDGPLPAVVWVHGGGARQNRFGWHPMRGYAIFYGFHQYLAQRGYVVLAVDYRGSIGYGRSFRVEQHEDLGGKDLEDLLAGARYLRRIPDVDIGRIGVWGLSYGGFLTLQALVQAPTAFDAGIDVAGVADWAAWAVDPGGLWIEGRMGPVDGNEDLYRERSPIHFVERLARPLLILHGTADRPVPVLQSMRLIDALVREGRDFEAMIYPGEQHVFEQRSTWLDAFGRAEEFFDRALR